MDLFFFFFFNNEENCLLHVKYLLVLFIPTKYESNPLKYKGNITEKR